MVTRRDRDALEQARRNLSAAAAAVDAMVGAMTAKTYRLHATRALELVEDAQLIVTQALVDPEGGWPD